MLLTAEQLAEIRQIIEDHHNAFVANTISPDALQKEVLDRLKEKGLIDVKVDSLTEAYLYGQVLAQLETAKAAKMTYPQFVAHLKKNPVVLTTAERNAVALAQSQAGQYCKGLGNRVSTVTGDILIEADQALRARMEATIRDTTAETLIRRETVQQLKSKIGWETGDWSRDLDRIAATELQNASELGVAQELSDEYGDDVLVSKVPNPDACPKCLELFLDKETGQPKVFRLSTLQANGTNVGRKQADWKAVVSTVHPHCFCGLQRIPPGWGWEDGELIPGVKSEIHSEEDLTKALSEEDEHEHFPAAGRTVFAGMPITIETKAGQDRHWTDAEGNTGTTRMLYDYGYVENTNGCDEDEVDVFVGPNRDAEYVYVCHQQNPVNGRYDEEKVFLGFGSEEAAAQAYLAHYTDHEFLVAVSVMGVSQFKRWVAATFPIPDEIVSVEELRLVVPITLKKAPVPKEFGGTSPDAANRAPGQGNVPNILFNIPHHPVQGPAKQLVTVLKDPTLKMNRKHAREAMTRDPRIWIFDEPAKRRIIGFNPGDHVEKYLKFRAGPAYDPAEQKKRLVVRGRKNVGFRNKPASGIRSET